MSKLEESMAIQLKLLKIPFEREVSGLVPERRFRVDFLIAGWLAVECQGGIYVKGGHSTGAGITRDCEKAAELLCIGYPTLHVTAKQIASGEAVAWIERLIENYKKKVTI